MLESRHSQAMVSKSKSRLRYVWFSVTSCVLLGLSGCAASHLRSDYNGYESAFAETSNREVLLNLARLDQHDPTYFFKLGQIGTTYRMQAALTGTGSYVIQGTGSGGNATGGGNPGVIFEKDPAFTFIPVNDDTTAKLLLQPIQPGLFEGLYQQGWRADQLFRLMVDRIEFRDPSDRNPRAWQIIRNSATRDNLFDYTRFLRVSALAYELQKRGWLVIRAKEQFVPLMTLPAASENPPAKTPANASPGAAGNASTTPPGNTCAQGTGDACNKPPAPDAAAGTKIADVLDAMSKNPNLTWRQIKNQWVLGQDILTPTFVLNDPFDENSTDCKPDPPFPGETQLQCYIEQDMPQLKLHNAGLAGTTLLYLMLKVLQNGFTIEQSGDSEESGGEANNTSSTDDKNNPNAVSCHLVMRSMIGLMSAAAQEQDGFYKLMHDDRPVVPSAALAAALDPKLAKGLANSTLSFKDVVPPLEQRPILKLTWGAGESGDGGYLQPLVALTYGTKQYMVTDCKPPSANSSEPLDLDTCGSASTSASSPENSEAPATTVTASNTDSEQLSWNRDVFRLIAQITAQVTVDISKFQPLQILQLHTD
jgi:hypothetical protein